jgi:polar amino acid transport system substrate-binding protein
MMKVMTPFLLGVCLILGLASCKDDSQKEKLIVGLSAEYPPFEYLQQGSIVGFDVDLAHELGKEMNKDVEIKDMNFSSIIQSLQSNLIDMGISAITVSVERKANIDFSDIYYQPRIAIIFKTDAPLKDLSALTNKSIGVQLGTTMELYLREQSKTIENLKIVPMNTNPMLIEELKVGRLAAVAVEDLQAKEFCAKNPSLSFILLDQFGEGYAIGFKKGSPLCEQANNALASLKQKGVLDALRKKWMGA